MKKVVARLKLRVPAGKASPTPAIASSLGPKGINLMKFCQACNELTGSYGSGNVRVRVLLYHDKTFDVQVKGRSSTDVVKSFLQFEKGSSAPGKDILAYIDREKISEMAQELMSSMNTRDFNAAMRTVVGKVSSMGIKISGDLK
ncbi:ribosomal L11, N-terminal domain protein [Neorickettsia helminthoeca str. Oregon]|uniref:Large ribosomal subunit protein uL11 n=1 Tax=Neorickettsia helminthoeca str. Oregon TaxID=1286528 RepID=X5HMA2_9RICK|nr:50S ribosomal protein L11 [Neorickettsia helminthoeca]AHX11580.1 ribosomal L11, N-terminal domain protein [Neorickettsia helminthoeca str. Oregon]